MSAVVISDAKVSRECGNLLDEGLVPRIRNAVSGSDLWPSLGRETLWGTPGLSTISAGGSPRRITWYINVPSRLLSGFMINWYPERFWPALCSEIDRVPKSLPSPILDYRVDGAKRSSLPQPTGLFVKSIYPRIHFGFIRVSRFDCSRIRNVYVINLKNLTKYFRLRIN